VPIASADVHRTSWASPPSVENGNTAEAHLDIDLRFGIQVVASALPSIKRGWSGCCQGWAHLMFNNAMPAARRLTHQLPSVGGCYRSDNLRGGL
jgi:hypothetical protein